MQWKNGPEGTRPPPDIYLRPETLTGEYNWIEVDLANDDKRFTAAYWVSKNCGIEWFDYAYFPVDRWLFRNHEAAMMFKLMFG